MANILHLIVHDGPADAANFSFMIQSPAKGRMAYVHMTADEAIKVAHRIMSLASSQGPLREKFEGASAECAPYLDRAKFVDAMSASQKDNDQ